MNVFKNLTKHRTFLMGVAMLLVFVFHSNGERWMPTVIGQVVSSWNIGVDVFIFLSAIGLSYSLNKNPEVWAFYKRRFFRIFPAYWFVMTCVYLCVFIVAKIGLIPENFYRIPVNCWEIIQAYTTLGFWLHNGIYYCWYIPAIIVFYLFFPLIHKAFNCNRLSYALIFVPSLLIAFGHIQLEGLRQGFLLRAGVFMYGGAFANEMLVKERTVNSGVVYLVGALSLVFYGMRLVVFDMPREFNRVIEESLFFVTLPCILACLIRFCNYKWIDVFVSFVGKLSLEFYLIHEFMLHVVGAFSKMICQVPPSLKILITFFLSLLASYIVHGIITKLLATFKI